MGQFQPPGDPSTVWLRSLIEAMDEVATSAAKPSAADREALAARLELPAMPAKGLGDPFSGPTNSLRHRAQAATAQIKTGRALMEGSGGRVEAGQHCSETASLA
jgi:hypothetical protein